MISSLWNTNGAPLLIQSSASLNQITISSRFNRFQLQPSTALARALLKLSASNLNTNTSSDGGLTCLGFASLLLSSGRTLLEQGYWMPNLIQEWNNGMHVVEQAMIQQSRRIALSDLESMKRIVISLLYPNVLSFTDTSDQMQRNHMASIVLDALLSSLDSEHAEPCVQVLSVEGSYSTKSFSAPNIVLMDIPLPTNSHLQLDTDYDETQGLILALFDSSLESIAQLKTRVVKEKNENNTTSSSISTPSTPSFASTPSTPFTPEESFISTMVNANVKVVASQKLIPRRLKRKLHASGIIALERLSLRYIRAVASISGAQVLGHTALHLLLHVTDTDDSNDTNDSNKNIDEIIPMFGKIKHVCIRRIGNKKFLQLKGFLDMPRPLSTLVLRSPGQHSLRELEDSVQCALRALPHLFRTPHVFPQDGVGERNIAETLKLIEPSTQGIQLLINAFEKTAEISNKKYMKNGLTITTLYIQELKQAMAAAVACIRTLNIE